MSEATNKFSPEERERAIRMVREHRDEYPPWWAAITSITGTIGCAPWTLSGWVKKGEIDNGVVAGFPSEVTEELMALERENRELRQANEILRKASAYLAQAGLDRPLCDDRLHRR